MKQQGSNSFEKLVRMMCSPGTAVSHFAVLCIAPERVGVSQSNRLPFLLVALWLSSWCFKWAIAAVGACVDEQRIRLRQILVRYQ